MTALVNYVGISIDRYNSQGWSEQRLARGWRVRDSNLNEDKEFSFLFTLPGRPCDPRITVTGPIYCGGVWGKTAMAWR